MTDALLLAGAFVLGFIVCAALSGVLLKVLVDLYRDDRDAHSAEREQFRSDRRELLNRLQHPNLVPTGTERPAPRPRDPVTAERLREMASVGRVVPGNGSDEMELP